MITASPLTVIPYERRHRTRTLELIDYSYLRHTHLDWYEADTWLDNVGGVVRLAWRGGQLAGVLAASNPMHGKAWVRLACVGEGWREDEVIGCLWASVRAGLYEVGAHECWLLPLDPWIETHVQRMGMAQAETLVSMRRNKAMSPAALAPIDGLTLHSGDLGDVAGMTAIDQAAFVPPFQMTALDMRYAYRGSTLCTVARLHGEMVGYQISTRHGLVGHLARLAVAPALHGRGIGAALVREMIAAFGRRQIESVTVNTQRSNTRSQHLYHGFGFEHTHHDVPMFRTVL